MFAGEGPAERTNRRFHLLAADQPAKRLSTAFDSITLYGEDPARRPDIYGKIGESGVSIFTVEEAERLYAGFDLCAKTTSVSMTINGPAPTILAFFFNAAIRQRCRRFLKAEGRLDISDEAVLQPDVARASTWAETRALLSDAEYERLAAETLTQVRGTVQADILKEDQGQNTCIFSTEFSLKLMGDVQAFFIDRGVRNFYSVSISGYHIAEAGANPIHQLAYTLANGFTYVEYYRARGMDVKKFAPNLSFFFSNGLDPEYTVIGRVARRIWAIAMTRLYGADARGAMLKYHIQTSGRSLHAMEIEFNDIRTTLQALLAVYDNAQSLHTNAYDEAITTPTEESVRRAMAIQVIINREFGLTKCENATQGSFIVEELTDLVEEAVLAEFDRLTERGGVLGAMERQYQRGQIQDDSLKYERLKHSGELPIAGVNTFLSRNAAEAEVPRDVALTRATPEEKEGCIERLGQFHTDHAEAAKAALDHVKEVALAGENLFAALMQAAEHCSLGQITRALYEVGGEYRRNL
jgi:methylmalonyl-CoA mutase